MFYFKSIVLIAAVALGVESSEVAVPAAFAAPVVAPAHLEYAHSVPYNVPPHAAQVNYVNRALSPLAAPFAAPFAAPVGVPFPTSLAAGPVPAGFPAPLAFGRFASPYVAGPVPAPYAFPGPLAAYAAPYPYAAPYGAPAFVR